MSSFTSELHITPDDSNPNFWIISSPFDFYLGGDGIGWKITVEEGFRTNFASSPRIMWSLIPPWGRYGKAAVVHDWLYASKVVSKRVADGIFWDAMTVLKVPICKKWLMFKAVVWFGGKAWNNS